MPTSRLTLSARYKPRSGDYLCLPFLDARTRAGDKLALPRWITDLRPPKCKGGARTAFLGQRGSLDLCVRVVRLDGAELAAKRQLKIAVAGALEQAAALERKRVVVVMDGGRQGLCRAVQEGALLGGYCFTRYLKKKKKPLPVLLAAPGATDGLKAVLADDAAVFECTNHARDVLNEPSNVIDPKTLADEYRRAGKAAGLKITVWDAARLGKERCGGILGVGQGAAVKPRLVIGEYGPPAGARKAPHLALVGKGVTFDSGGYCLKPPASQIGMKWDMGGAAATFGAACAIARLKLPIRLTVLTPLVRNDISSTAYHTTDILTMRNGMTVQVDNTDAEGRLILADALCLAAERKPDFLLDAATLTGANVVALGEDIAGAFGTDPEFTQRLLAAGAAVGEDFWEMPLYLPYRAMLKTTVADCKNIGKRWGGAITAALFLKQFVPEKMKWIHCDIAGPAGKEDKLQHLGKGAKGFGVKTFVEIARKIVE